MKVLLSAYACEPGHGSEPEIGWQALLEAAKHHEVWVLTRENNRDALEESLSDHEHRERIHVHAFDLAPLWMRLKHRLGPIGVFLYYVAWQRRAGHEARQLMEQVGFDVVHHVTFAIHWLPVGVSAVDAPLVLGPVGRGLKIPMRLWPALGPGGAVFEAVRLIVQGIGRAGTRGTVKNAAVVITQNREAAVGLPSNVQVVVFPNAAAVGPFEFAGARPRTRSIAIVARVIPWKGIAIAIRALTHVPDATLTIYGDGPDQRRLGRLAEQLGVGDRVIFAGPVPRDDLFEAVRTHRVVLHPALREEAGMAVSEALALGTPVVALDRGGPRVLAMLWPDSPCTLVSDRGSIDAVAKRLAEAVEPFLHDPHPPQLSGSAAVSSFGDVLLSAYDLAKPTG